MVAIIEDYVSLETAKVLKEKGFLKGVDLRTTQNLSFYDNIGLTHNLNKYYDSLIQDKIDFVVAPTLQMAMRWLRDIHNIMVSPYALFLGHYDLFLGYYFEIFDLTNGDITGCKPLYKVGIVNKEDILSTYEKACEAGIKYCLENLI